MKWPSGFDISEEKRENGSEKKQEKTTEICDETER